MKKVAVCGYAADNAVVLAEVESEAGCAEVAVD